MKCNIVKDLIPLYIDGCCSKESEEEVKSHLKGCDLCQQYFDDMKAEADVISTPQAPVVFKKINDWKASVLQSVLLFISFGLITIGVANEAGTDYIDMFNGLYAINIVVPATGFMLSLANWYFVKVYKSRKAFSNTSLFITLAITIFAYVWCCFHYEISLTEILGEISFAEITDIMQSLLFLHRIGIVLTLVFCTLSKVLSGKYAEMLGKE